MGDRTEPAALDGRSGHRSRGTAAVFSGALSQDFQALPLGTRLLPPRPQPRSCPAGKGARTVASHKSELAAAAPGQVELWHTKYWRRPLADSPRPLARRTCTRPRSCVNSRHDATRSCSRFERESNEWLSASMGSLAKLNLMQALRPRSPPHWPFGGGPVEAGPATHHHPTGDDPGQSH
jgi:hypothetical protein